MKLYCRNARCGGERKTKAFQPEPGEHICECGGWMGTFKPRVEPPTPARDRVQRQRSKARRSGFTPASRAQKARVNGLPCVVCGLDGYEASIDPAHVIPRSLGGCDGELCVVPLCRAHHRAYDQEGLDLLPHLEGQHWRSTLAHAVEHVGLVTALERITNARWAEREAA